MKIQIKKQLFFNCLLFLSSFSLVHATVDPQSDEGIRQIVEKVGTTVEDITIYTEDALNILDSLEEFVTHYTCSPIIISSVPYTINQPGCYIFETDLTLTTTEISPAITIDANNVLLCMCGKVLKGSAGSTGITIENDHINVAIKSGLISTFNTGMSLGTGCENIKIEDVDVVDCELIAMDLVSAAPLAVKGGTIAHCYRGVRVTGEDSGQLLLEDLNISDCEYEGLILKSTTVVPLTDGVVRHCSVTKTATAPLGSGDTIYAVYLSTCTGILITDCSFNDNGNAANDFGTFRAFGLVGCSHCVVKGTQANRNVGSRNLSAFYLSESSENIFERCSVVENIVSNGSAQSIWYTVYGFNAVDSSDTNIFAYCSALSNSSEPAVSSSGSYFSYGFYSDSNRGNIYLDCIANNQYANHVAVLSRSGDSNKMQTRIPLSHSYGFFSDDDVGFQYIRCIAADNYSTSSGYGFFVRGSGVAMGEIKDCQALHNNYYGFLVYSGVSSRTPLFIRNIACQNGTANYRFYGGYELSAPVSSPANARGVDNVDCSLTDEDSIDVIESKVFEMNSKVLVMDSLVDELMP